MYDPRDCRAVRYVRSLLAVTQAGKTSSFNAKIFVLLCSIYTHVLSKWNFNVIYVYIEIS